MKYIPPATGQYKSALRAESLYSIVESFLQSTPHSEIEAGIKAMGGPRNVWNLEPMISELKEFVVSYFVGSFREQMPELEEILLSPTERWKNLEDYITNMGERYDSDLGIKEMVESSRRQFNRNKSRLKRETLKIKKLQDRDESIQIVAHDVFGHLCNTYDNKSNYFFNEVTGRRFQS